MGKCAHGVERFPELNRVAWLKTLPKWSVGAEIGVRAAKFSRRILRTVKPSLLWLVDCWSTQPKVPYNLSDECYLSDMRKALRRVRGEILSGVVRVVCGFSREVVELVPDKSLDWLYVDAGHTYMECHEDLCLWFPKVKPGGIVAGHDYLEELHIGVIGAVHDFMEGQKQHGLKVTAEKVGTFWFVKQ